VPDLPPDIHAAGESSGRGVLQPVPPGEREAEGEKDESVEAQTWSVTSIDGNGPGFDEAR